MLRNQKVYWKVLLLIQTDSRRVLLWNKRFLKLSFHEHKISKRKVFLPNQNFKVYSKVLLLIQTDSRRVLLWNKRFLKLSFHEYKISERSIAFNSTVKTCASNSMLFSKMFEKIETKRSKEKSCFEAQTFIHQHVINMKFVA